MKRVVKTILIFFLIFGTIFTVAFVASMQVQCFAEEVQPVVYKQALVEVWTMPGCSPCQWVKQNAVPSWKRSAKVFVIDYTKYENEARAKGLNAYPTIIVYSPDKKETKRFTSGRPYSYSDLVRAVQSEINKVNLAIERGDYRHPIESSESSSVSANGIDSVINQESETDASDDIVAQNNDIGFIPPAYPVNEYSFTTGKLGNIFGFSDDEDGNDQPLKEDNGGEEEKKSPKSNPLLLRDRELEGNGIGSTALDSIVSPIVDKATSGIRERIDELKKEIKSSVMQAAIIGSLIAMFIYAALKTVFGGMFVLLKTMLIKLRNWFCSSVATITTNIAASVTEKVNESKQSK